MKKRFNFRVFTSIFVGMSFLMLVFSGIVLYFVPPGRIANWIDWRFLGLTKTAWEGIHIWFSLLFLIFGVLHIYYNWNPILHYFKRLKKESLSATIFGIVFLVLGILGTVPVVWLMDLRASIKDSYEVSEDIPPIPHMELFSVKEIASKLNMSVEEVIEKLAKAGVRATGDDRLEDLAKRSGKTPKELYTIIVSQKESRVNHGFRRGFGRKTVKGISEELGVPVEKILVFLKKKHIKATPDSMLKDLAFSNGLMPYELYEMIYSEFDKKK